MVDNLSLLEERVDGLLKNLERAHRRNEELRGRVSQLEQEVVQWREKSQQLQRQMDNAQQELVSTSGKEDVIRERLRAILERIDAIEGELGETANAD